MDFWVVHPRVEEYVMDLLLLLLLAMIMLLNYYDDINLSMPLEINQARAPQQCHCRSHPMRQTLS